MWAKERNTTVYIFGGNQGRPFASENLHSRDIDAVICHSMVESDANNKSKLPPPTVFHRSERNILSVPELKENKIPLTKTASSLSAKSTFVVKSRTALSTRSVNASTIRGSVNSSVRAPSSSVSMLNSSVLNRTAPVAQKTSSSSVTTAKKRMPWDLKGRLEDLQELYDRHKKESEEIVREVETEKNQLLEKFSNAEEKFNQFEEEKQRLTLEISDLSEQIDRLKGIEKDQTEKISALTKKMKETDVKLSMAEASINSYRQELDCITVKYKESSENLMKYQSLNHQLEIKLNALQDENQNLLQNLKSCQDQICDKDKELLECQYQLCQQDMERRQLHHQLLELRGTIRVICRVRPVLPSDNGSGDVCNFEYQNINRKLLFVPPNGSVNDGPNKKISGKNPLYEFHLDKLFGRSSGQKEVFDEIEPLVQSALDGYNVCVFAYGQTGSGKTYTMEGKLSECDSSNWGMIPRTVDKIFSGMAQMERNGWVYRMEVSFIEIYNECLRDLLCKEKNPTQKPEIKMVPSFSNSMAKSLKRTESTSSLSENDKFSNDSTNKFWKRSSSALVSDDQSDSKISVGYSTEVQVTNLTSVRVTGGPEEVLELLRIANKNRIVAATNCNQHSSRSHSVFQLKLYGENKILSEISEGTVNLIDLAGSERLKESGAVGDRLKETQHINKSLSALKTVITSLSGKEGHVPYRDSKLTHLLQSSLGGNSKSLMIVNVSPCDEHAGETLCSLRFASQVNKCHIGVATQKKSVVV